MIASQNINIIANGVGIDAFPYSICSQRVCATSLLMARAIDWSEPSALFRSKGSFTANLTVTERCRGSARWAYPRPSLLPIKLDVVPLRQHFDELERVEREF